MKSLLIRLSMIIIIILLSMSIATPALAWTGAYTGWQDFDSFYAEFSMFLANYYQNFTDEDVELGWSYFYIDNWGEHPWGGLSYLENHGYYGYGSSFLFKSFLDPVIDPGEFAVEYLTMGESTYSLIDAILVQNTASSSPTTMDVGMWKMWWHDNLTITTEYYD